MNATRILAGRRESELLAFPSVRRMADILAARCREPSWVRTSVASLERFRTMTGHIDLEMLLTQAKADPAAAEQALASFACALSSYSEDQVSALAMGVKIWFRLNGVDVPWRPLPGSSSAPVLATADRQGTERVILLALIGSGLRLAGVVRPPIRGVGSLGGGGGVLSRYLGEPPGGQDFTHPGAQ